MGFDLKSKTIGIIGAGHIGLHVIRMAKGFGMKVVAHDVRQDHFLAEVLDFAYAPLEQLLAQSDVISLNRILDTTVDNILAYVAGKPINVVRD